MDLNYIIIKTPTREFEVSKKLLEQKETYFTALKRICDIENSFTDVSEKNKVNTDCPEWVFTLILDYFNTDTFEYFHLRESEKKQLKVYLKMYCIVSMIDIMEGTFFQKKQIPQEYLDKYKKYIYYMNNHELNKDDLLVNLHGTHRIPTNKLQYLYDPQCICKKRATFLYTNDSLSWNCLYTFKENISKFTFGFIDTLTKDDWDFIFLAGGSVYHCLNNIIGYSCNSIPSDIDLFIKNHIVKDGKTIILTDKEVEDKIMLLCEKIANYFNNLNDDLKQGYNDVLFDNKNDIEQCVYRTPDTITFALKNNTSNYISRRLNIQIIYKRLYKSNGEILASFDIDSSQCGYNGTNVYLLETSVFALIHKINIAGIDKKRESPSYVYRLKKYAERGTAIYIPGLNIDDVKFSIIFEPEIKLSGLALLLYYDLKLNNRICPLDIPREQIQQNCESNYDILKIPDNINKIEFACKLWIYNVNDRADHIIFPIVFIPYNKWNRDEWKNIIDFRPLYQKFTEFSNIETYNNMCENYYQKMHNDDISLFDYKATFNKIKDKFEEVDSLIIKNQPEIDKSVTNFQFRFCKFGWIRTFERIVTINTSIKPWLEFEKINPGDQKRSFHKKEIGFFDQAYGEKEKHYRYDINKDMEIFS